MQCLTLDTQLEIAGTTQYKNYNMMSAARFGDMVIGVDGSSIFELDGDDDDGDLIESEFRLIKTDLGISWPKHMQFAYIKYKSDTDLILETFTDDQEESSFEVPANGTFSQRTRVTISDDKVGTYWSFTIKNIAGARFSIYSIEVLPIVVSHGFV